MDKKKIEEFATSSRKQLIENLTYEANRIGITKEKIYNPTDTAEDMQTYTTAGVTNTIYGKQIEQREQLVQEIENNGFDQTIEKIAYTWFNRIIAIRYMEVNNYLPTHTRVLSSITSGQKEPDIITEALNLNEYFQYTQEEEEKIYQYKEENQTDELFKLLFIKQCNKLNEILPELFETIDDYTEILFNIQLSNPDNIINKLVTSIPEEDFQNQVEIIGWIYQYYNKELKDETYKNIKKVKVGKDRIPAVTQLFTPDWIVKYMVENSLGRLWLENHENEELKNSWKYYIEEAEQTDDVQDKLDEIKSTYKDTKLEEIKILDPSMGSGHILVYVFDVLLQIYISQGYTKKEAVINILKNNIYGIDIDDRAYQLAYFAIMMKARSYHRRILNQNIKPNLLAIQETNTIPDKLMEIIESKYPNYSKEIIDLIETFKNGKTLGSITKINEKINLNNLNKIMDNLLSKSTIDISLINYSQDLKILKEIIIQTKLLSQKYDIIITNPPYMGNNNMNDILTDYVKKNYPNTKRDLFSVFMEKGFSLIKKNGFNVMVTMQSWMFLPSFETFRKEIFKKYYINSLLHMGNLVMGITFGTCATVFRKNTNTKYNAHYNYIEIKDINEQNIPFQFPIISQRNITNSIENYLMIPESPICYWINKNFVKIFNTNKKMCEITELRQGLATSDNNRFLRLWYELNFDKIGFNSKNSKEALHLQKKWYPFNKGGKYRKWYGNQDYVINYENDGEELKNFAAEKYKSFTRTIKSISMYFKPNIAWSLITDRISFRYFQEGFIFDHASGAIFTDNPNYILGLLNSNISQYMLESISPTVNFNVGQIGNIPIILDMNYNSQIDRLVQENISIVKSDWDENEISWNFTKHPLFKSNTQLTENFKEYSIYKENQFSLLKNNEIELNEIFANIYHENSIDTDVEDKYVSVRKADYEKDIKSFISYAVGCMFGRYSLDKEGLVYSGGEFDITSYSNFVPDEDNIIPVLDEEYFDDDIVNKFVEFVEIAFGKENLNENLDFIANALNNKGQTSRQIIRNYFIKDFWEEHKKMYSVTMRKAPIYWMFDSGKQNAFKCLIYMHRYEPDLVSRIRHDYLHKTQRSIEENIKQQDNIIKNSENQTRVTRANKEKTKLVKQLDEIKLYDLALAHVAGERIELDLDDGVKVNYAKFQNVEVVNPNTNKTKKINLLKKL